MGDRKFFHDLLRGEDGRTKYRSLTRRHFDLVIFALVGIYGAAFVILLMAKLHPVFCE